MTRRISQFALLARWLVGLGLLAVVVWSVDWGQVGNLLRESHWWLALPIMIAISATNCFAARAWQLLVVCFSRVRLSLWEAVRLYYIAQTLGSITPINVGSDLYRIHAITARGGRLTEALAVVFLQRLTGAQAIALLGGVAAFAIPLPAEIRHAITVTMAILLIGGSIALWLACVQDGWLLKKVRLDSITSAKLRKAVSIGIAFALAFYLSRAVLGGVLVNTIGVQIPFLTAVAALMLACLTILLPFTVNGFGFMEGALAFLFAKVGATAEAGLIVGVLLRLSGIITAAIGVAFLWGQRGKASGIVQRVEKGAGKKIGG